MINISLPTITQKMTQTKRFFFLLLCLAIGQVLVAQTTYSTVKAGSYNVASTWDANGIPPNPIPADATVEINHNIQEGFITGVSKTNYGTININDDAILIIYKDFDNYGTINAKGGPTYSEFRIVIATFNNKAGGVLKTSGGPAASITGWSDALLNNEAGGLVEVAPDGELRMTSQGNNRINNSGTIDNRGSTLSYGAFVNTAGSKLYQDNGRVSMINAPLTIGGEVKLIGASSISVQGSLNIEDGSSIEWVLTSQPSGFNYPTIQQYLGVGTYGTIDMKVSLAPGFEPEGGDIYNLFNFTSTVPTDPISLPALTGGKTWKESRVPDYNGIRIEVEDESCEPTAISCPSNIVRSNDNGQCGAVVTFSLPSGASAIPPSGSFFPVGTTTVNVTGSDGCDGTSTCSFTVTVNDTEKPSVSNCPSSNLTFNNTPGQCGTILLLAFNAVDNCTGATLEQTEGLPSGSLYPVGETQMTYVATDASDNTGECSFTITVKDNQDPVAVCKDVTVNFNGEASIDLTPSQVWNQAASSDNCGNVYYAGTSPSLSISCDDLGNTVPLTVTIHDGNGNMDNCTADVTVTGLPCGWSEGDDDGSLNCAGNTAVDYDVDDESFAVSADGCWHDCRDSDKAAYVYQELCGDGTLTARLASINSGGYAGLMLRESLDPDARRVGALKNTSTRRVRREYRATYGGIVTQSHSNRSRVKWFRIVRKGDEVKSYTSTNGSYWRLLYRVVLPNLDDCVNIGMMAYSSNGSSTVDAVFDNVSFSGSGSSLIDNNNSLPNSFTAFDTDLEIEQPAVNIFPNPSNGQSQIELNGFQETPAQIMVRDAFGKVVRQIELDNPEGAMLPLDLQDMPAGLYLISVMQDQQQVITKKLMIQR